MRTLHHFNDEHNAECDSYLRQQNRTNHNTNRAQTSSLCREGVIAMQQYKRRHSSLAALAVMGVAVALVGCSSDNGGGTSGETTDNEAGGNLEASYTVATDSGFVPFEFEQDGEHVGFDMDIIQAIADEVGFEIDLQVTNFDGIIPGLQTGSFDIAIAGITITEERQGTVDFTSPYYQSGIRIGVPIDNEDINSIEDLAGKNVAVRLGSAPLDYITEHVPEANTLPFEQLDQAYLAVEGGSADAIFYDAPNVEYYISTAGEGKLKLAGELYEAQNYGIAVAKGNEDLVAAMNEALATIIEDGRYTEIYETWFGEAPEWLDDLAAQAD